jgi:DNA-binding transcriptional ArsR family regulator
MAHPESTFDVFKAIAEPRRRQIIAFLSKGDDQPVGSIVAAMGLPQPAVSKHLGFLRAVGVVVMSKRGQRRLYRLNGAGLKPLHDWVSAYEHFWKSQLDRIKVRAERQAAGEKL